jgi:hypothetical protein
MFGSLPPQQQQAKRTIQGSLSKTANNTPSSGIIWRTVSQVIALVTVVALVYHGRRIYSSKQQAATTGTTSHHQQQSETHGVENEIKQTIHENVQRNHLVDKKPKPQKMRTRETLLVKTTSHGNLRIMLRSDLSPESVAYIHQMLQVECSPCNLYRAEAPGILQGILHNDAVPVPTQRGVCPPGFETVPNTCPEWDVHCACHGPVMTRGMVGWAAGETGPDFFINNYQESMEELWGTQHTVWGGTYVRFCTHQRAVAAMSMGSAVLALF